MRNVLPAFTLTLPLALSCAVEERGSNASVSDAISLWDRFAQLSCQLGRSCCEQAQFGSDALANCEQELTSQMGIAQLIRYVGDESMVMDRVLFTRCLDEAEKHVEVCGQVAPIESCVQSMHGTREEGEACESVVQCAGGDDGALCLRVVEDVEQLSDTTPGVCHNQLRGKRGDACVHTCTETPCLLRLTTYKQPDGTAFCFWEDGLYCDRTEGRCAALVARGDECRVHEACGEEAFCADALVCQRSAAAGEACAGSEGECAGGLTCSETSGKCEESSLVSEDFCAGDLD